MIRIDNALYLPPSEEIKTLDDIKSWIDKLSNLLNNNQGDLYQDINNRVDKKSSEIITGQKTFFNILLGSDMNCNQKQLLSMVIENRTSTPENPTIGQIWIRTDLL